MLTARVQILLKDTSSVACLGASCRKCFSSFSLGMWLKLSCINVALNGGRELMGKMCVISLNI